MTVPQRVSRVCLNSLISGWSVIIAVVVSSLVGVIFGTAPAARAANLDPVESLRYE